jgi:hypothetical protein
MKNSQKQIGIYKCKISCGLIDLNDNFLCRYTFPKNVDSILNPHQATLENHWLRFSLEFPSCQGFRYIPAPYSVSDIKVNQSRIKTTYCNVSAVSTAETGSLELTGHNGDVVIRTRLRPKQISELPSTQLAHNLRARGLSLCVSDGIKYSIS